MKSFLNRKIFSSEGDVFGLDLSDLSVKILKLADNGTRECVDSFSSVKIPQGCVNDGEIQKKDQVVQAIKKAVAVAGPKKIRTKKVICSLPETKAFLRIISIPVMAQEEINEAVKWEMEANIPLSFDQVYYDWQILPATVVSEKDKMNLLVVAVARSVVDQAIEVLEAAELEPVGLEIESIAQTRSLLNEKEKEKTVLVVDIGDRRTSFSISKDGFPTFTSSIPLCGQSLTEVIASGMGVTFEEAENIKFANGIGSEAKNDALFKLALPVIENFYQEIERCTDFYLSVLKYSTNIDKIIICGGGANTKGIVPYLSRKLGREIEMGNPWINLNLGKDLPIIDKNQSVQYSTAIGLALKGLHYEDLP
ncbi:MAG TPA: type IV pilus assembly protein PilM [Patescibacteria group bacterium]